jgi:hypothetical protein
MCCIVVILASCKRKPQSNGTKAPEAQEPAIVSTTTVRFNYQSWNYMMNSRIPRGPNSWYVESEITSKDKEALEFLPVYFFAEGGKTNNGSQDNAMTVSPKQWEGGFGKDYQVNIRIAPEDLKEEVSEGVGYPMDQLSEPPKGNMAAMVGERSFSMALKLNGQPALWQTTTIAPQQKWHCGWGFASVWAASKRVRVKSSS